MKKEIIILTKSSRHKGFCVAGIDTKTKQWVRLLTTNKKINCSLSKNNMKLTDGNEVNVLDKVILDVIESCPTKLQPENVLINENHKWEKVSNYKIDEFLSFYSPEKHQYIFENTNEFLNNEQISKVGISLIITVVENASINIKNDYKRKISFTYNNRYYDSITVTDPDYYNIPNNTNIGKVAIVVSLLDDEWSHNNNKYYKFVAKIFPLT